MQQQEPEVEPHHGARARLLPARFAHQGGKGRIQFADVRRQPIGGGDDDPLEQRPQVGLHRAVADRPPDDLLGDRAGATLAAGLEAEFAAHRSRQPEQGRRRQRDGGSAGRGKHGAPQDHEKGMAHRLPFGTADRPRAMTETRVHGGGDDGRMDGMVPEVAGMDRGRGGVVAWASG